MLTENEKIDIRKKAKGLAKYFKIEFTLSLFGQVIIHWVYPPQQED